MKIIAFDETEKYIMKGVIQSVRPEDREQSIVEFLQGNLNNPALNDTSDGVLMLDILSGLLEKILNCSHEKLIDILDGDYSNVFDEEDMIWLPFNKEEAEEVYNHEFGKKEEPPYSNGQQNTKAIKRNSAKKL